MDRRGMLGIILLCGFLAPRAYAAPGNATSSGSDSVPPWARRPPVETLATVTLGLSACYSPYGFPRTNEHLGNIVDEIQKAFPSTRLGDLDSDLGIQGYVQFLIYEGWGARLSLQHVKAHPPAVFGVVRGDVSAETSPLNLSYSLVREIPLRHFRLVLGAGIDQYRWTMHWEFSEIGEDPIEEYDWEGRGTGAHGFVEAAGTFYGLRLLVGAAYHGGVYEMNLQDLPPTTQLVRYPRRYEEDVRSFQLYGGVTVSIF